MKHQIENDVSICVFGSSARDSADELSDRDVLVVGTKIGHVRGVANKWRDNGWSVSIYSRKRFQSLADAGSLFVQHLRQEGKIVTDQADWLRNTLDAYRPKQCYKDDTLASYELARPIERIWQRNIKVGLAADLGYVFLRNFGIYKCAQDGVYLFDYFEILEELQAKLKFSDQCRNGLSLLRKGKHNYRSGITDFANEQSAKQVADLLMEVCTGLRLRSLTANAPIRNFTSSYAVLRDCEAALIANGLSHSEGSPSWPELQNVWRVIRKPRDYSWQVRSIDQAWINTVNRIFWDTLAERKMVS